MKCFYHSSDLDGHCSGAIVKMKYPDCEMIGINYGDNITLNTTIDPEETVYMVDFCLQPFDGMEELNKRCKFHWIDHHAKGSIDEAHERGFLASGGQLLEVGRAGCELTWEYIHGDKPVPTAVRLLGRYDVWDHSDINTLPFQYGMRQFTSTKPQNQALWKDIFMSDIFVSKIIDDGKMLLKYEEAQNEKFCKAYAFETIMPGHNANDDEDARAYCAICANRGFTNSKIFDSVYDPDKHHIMITFCRLKPPAGKWTVSIYSTREDVDCGAIAKSFGGGGHKGAAGFQCDKLPFAI